jgi:hypothetical protein
MHIARIGPAIAATAITLATSPAAADSVKQVFEKHDLIGVFAWDCTRPASSDNNWYYVDRVIDEDHMQRDFMTGPTKREWFAIIDKAAETKPNEIFYSGTVDGKPVEGVWRLEPKGVQQWSSKQSGMPLIDNGKLVKTGKPMPLLNRCGAQ